MPTRPQGRWQRLKLWQARPYEPSETGPPRITHVLSPISPLLVSKRRLQPLPLKLLERAKKPLVLRSSWHNV